VHIRDMHRLLSYKGYRFRSFDAVRAMQGTDITEVSRDGNLSRKGRRLAEGDVGFPAEPTGCGEGSYQACHAPSISLFTPNF
jgi:hypothetical protein